MSPIIVDAGVNEVVVNTYTTLIMGCLGGRGGAVVLQALLIYKLNCLQSGKCQLCKLVMMKMTRIDQQMVLGPNYDQ